MNYVAKVFIFGWAFSVSVLAFTDLVVLEVLGILGWVPFSAVLWLGGFLAVVLGLMYAFGRMLGYIPSGGGQAQTTQRRQSKGARER